MITKKEVEHISKLAKIDISSKDLDMFTKQLGDILEFFKKLEKAKTGHVQETSQVTGLENVSRPDEIEMSDIEEELVECTPHKIEKKSIKIPKIM
ncbi:Asp-tRNA(Asn)/Glu-tRNA(Gln) amidotransferase subunit GatC [Candidatus Gracilibacteria bacterium]|nr:Asp-tRNA(Asn)/Glu-tRNA(Gln) amidotransferase subunit GatC [Candidatus Gracilibacteria bacterium]